VVITALRDQAGVLVGFAKVTRDLTDRLRVEQERTHALAMEEAARRKDEFLAVMGHELRNPLASIVTAAHLMKLRGGRANEKEVDVIDRQARHMTRLVDDLLDASRALRDKVVLFPKKVDIGVVLANAIELASTLLEHRRHALTVDVPEGLVVHVDVERMGQVFGNILSNAAKYTPQGGRIHMSADAIDDHVSVRIEDNGRGIAPELLAQVFDLFVQGEQGIERKEGGLGIGLAVARKFVEAHRGEIRVESAGTGRGTRFTVRLPISREASPEVVAEEAPAPSRKRRRVLLVDDNHDSVDLLRGLLEHLGHEAHVAYDGPTGVQAFRELEPDIVLLDIGLPGLSGYEVLAQMRAMPAGEKAAIIAVSGYARDVDRARAFAAGFTEHLGKPIEMGRLEDLLGGEGLRAHE
jgi:CheY-like chemotaxis protein